MHNITLVNNSNDYIKMNDIYKNEVIETIRNGACHHVR